MDEGEAMGANCCNHTSGTQLQDRRYRRVLLAVLVINASMFLIEIVAGLAAGSASLQADALDFLADVANYGISLLVLGSVRRYRSTAALAKGVSMGVLGIWVMATCLWHAIHRAVPEPLTMGAVGGMALIANAVCFALLWAYRSGDSNMRSVWLCSRNDVIGNFAVLLASLGVFGTGTGWPDVIVAAVMSVLALQGGWRVIRQASGELTGERALRDPMSLLPRAGR